MGLVTWGSALSNDSKYEFCLFIVQSDDSGVSGGLLSTNLYFWTNLQKSQVRFSEVGWISMQPAFILLLNPIPSLYSPFYQRRVLISVHLDDISRSTLRIDIRPLILLQRRSVCVRLLISLWIQVGSSSELVPYTQTSVILFTEGWVDRLGSDSVRLCRYVPYYRFILMPNILDTARRSSMAEKTWLVVPSINPTLSCMAW